MVLGWVDIKVLVGIYYVIKVEMEGEWSKEFNLIVVVVIFIVISS